MPDFVDIPINVGEVILGARMTGSGETIVILPSLARGALDFDPLARLLAVAGYRVISIEPRGIGGAGPRRRRYSTPPFRPMPMTRSQ